MFGRKYESRAWESEYTVLQRTKTTQDIAGNLTIYIKLCYLVTDVYKNLQPKIQEV